MILVWWHTENTNNMLGHALLIPRFLSTYRRILSRLQHLQLLFHFMAMNLISGALNDIHGGSSTTNKKSIVTYE